MAETIEAPLCRAADAPGAGGAECGDHQAHHGGLLRPVAARIGSMNAFHEPCHLARFVCGQCDACGAWPEQLHIPTKKHGWFCVRCCPVCQQRAVKATLADGHAGIIVNAGK